MPVSELKLIKRCAEFQPRDRRKLLPPNIRGIYALLQHNPRSGKYDVVYIGMAGGKKASVRGRLRIHTKKKHQRRMWSHFSVFEVWDNITEAEVTELEGLFRHIYRKDSQANRVNRQRGFKKLKRVRLNNLRKWRVH